MGLPHIRLNSAAWIVIVVAVTLAVLYLRTAAPALTWLHDGDDGGDLATAAFTGGIPHPPGYPTYMLAARLAIALQGGSVASRTNRLSAYAGALTAGLVGLLGYVCLQTVYTVRLRPRLAAACAILAGLAYGTTPLPWSQAVITEVYTFGSLFTLAALLLGIRLIVLWTRQDKGRRSFATAGALGIVVGLGFGAHTTIVFSLVFVSLLLVLTRERAVRLALPIAPGLILGLLVFLLIPLSANRSATSNWGNPTTLDGFLWIISAAPYQSLVQWGVFPERLAFLAQRVVADFNVILLLVGIYGFWLMWDVHRPLAIAALVTCLANIQWTTMYYVEGILPYLLITYAFLAAWIGVGLYAAVEEVRRRWDSRFAGAGVCGLALLVIGFNTVANYPRMDASQAVEAEAYGIQIVDALPTGALVLSDQTNTTFALWYAKAVARNRSDLIVIDTRLLHWDWYRQTLAHFYPVLNPRVPYLPIRDLLVQSASLPLFAVFDPSLPGIRAEAVDGVPLFRLRVEGNP